MKRSLVIGVTGGFGTGKTTVSAMLAKRGATVVNADRIAHHMMLPGGAAYKKVLSLFGKKILSRNGRIDRKLLGKIVFADIKKLKLLNGLIHPEVTKKIKETISKDKGGVVLDCPLLIESGLERMVDIMVVVTAKKRIEVNRAKKRHHLKEVDVLRRIRRQMPIAKKIELADFIIDNNGSLKSTRILVEKAWRKIRDGRKKQ